MTKILKEDPRLEAPNQYMLWKSTLIESHQWNKTKMCGAKDSGNPRSKCLQAITHTKS